MTPRRLSRWGRFWRQIAVHFNREERMPKGKAQKLTDAELDAAAEITPEDIDRAEKAWKRDAPKKYRKLLDAKPEDTNDRS